jgi:hypothetical protein
VTAATAPSASPELTVREVAELKGCSERYVRRTITDGKQTVIMRDGIYMIPVEHLPPELKRKYTLRHRAAQTMLPEAVTKAAQRELETLTDGQRAQISLWVGLLDGWQAARAKQRRKTDADEPYVSALRLDGIQTNVATLYRKWAAYAAGDLNGLLDKRGGWNRGQSRIPEDVWNYYLLAYLDDRCISKAQCYDLCVQWTREFLPELADGLPGERTFRRRLEAEVPEAVDELGRRGHKSFEDRCAPYITRMYDDLRSNDYWVADNHTLDIISRREDGSEGLHRLSLTALIDARSGVIVGWNLTDNPNSQSTVLAMRHAILRFGLPRKVYFDNGSEFLTHDLAGRGHRRRKSDDLVSEPPPIFIRLGIEMTNAIVRNAKAKPIERTFGTFKGTVSRLFATFTGGNILEKPESLKMTLKRGEVPFDSQLREQIAAIIDGVYNVGAYGGSVAADKGKTRIEVWNESIAQTVQRKATADDLNLMLMRSSRPQKIGRNGAHLAIYGERLEYWTHDTWELLGQSVYLRYDPADLRTVRVYDADTDRYLRTLPLALSTTIPFDANSEDIALAQETVRKAKRAVREQLTDIRSRLPAEQQIDALAMRLRQAYEGRSGFVVRDSSVIEPVRADEEPLQQAVGADVAPVRNNVVPVDFHAMVRALEAQKR